MLNFISIYRNPSNVYRNAQCDDIEHKLNRHSKYKKIYDNGWFLVYAVNDGRGGMGICQFYNGYGMLLGHIFNSQSDSLGALESKMEYEELSEFETLEINSTNGENLFKKYWGSYVAFIIDDKKKCVNILRSPMGTYPCYLYNSSEGFVLFSDFLDFVDIFNPNLHVDWEMIPAYLLNSVSGVDRTCIKDIKIIPHGYRYKIGDRGIQKYKIWNPINFYENNRINNARDSGIALKNAIYSSFAAWSNVFSQGVLRLSGGLDSSIVAGVMSDLPRKAHLVCINQFYRSSLTDERAYARITAEKTGYKLYEMERDASDFDITGYQKAPRTAWPVQPPIDIQFELFEERISENYGATVRLTGLGGDAILAALKFNYAAIDYYIEKGFSKGAISALMQSARLSGTSLWETARTVRSAKKEYKTRIKNTQTIDSWGLTTNAIELFESKNNDSDLAGNFMVPPGKCHQLKSLNVNINHIHAYRDMMFLQQIDPLMSQPIVECCLSIPYYILQLNGRERGLAREALRDVLVDQIRLRQYKSHYTPLYSEALLKNREYYLKFLLNGILVGRGFLDKKTILGILNSQFPQPSEIYLKIMHFADIEAWVRAWE